jgi:DNA-binding NarL/FixJ family response regulator
MVGFFLVDNTMALVAENQDYDTLASGVLAFILVAVFFGYPASLIRSIHETKAEIADAEDSLCETKELIAAVVDPNALSCRELEILESLSGGQTNAKIAAELHISEKTVKNHLYRIYKKLGISSREEAIIYYHNKTTPKKDNNS